MQEHIQKNAGITANSEQIAKLKALFPGCFDKDGRFRPDKLEEVLRADGADITREGYKLDWLGKSYARLLANLKTETLLAANSAHNSKPENASSENLLIQGDNLDVLKHLVNAYGEKVKMIYIDPPYNTGSDGFVYEDNRSFTAPQLAALAGINEDEAKRVLSFTRSKSNTHSAWLTFMYPRLYIARELLREDGVIFISIDDNEQAQLKLLCDEVFGEENELVPFIWSLPRGINAGHISRAHEYVMGFAKQKSSLPLFIKQGNDHISIDRCNKKIDKRHPASKIKFPKGIRYTGNDKVISGEISGSEKITIEGQLRFENGKLAEDVTLEAGWTMKNMIQKWLDGKDVYDNKGQKVIEFFFRENGKLYSKKKAVFESPKSILFDVPDTQIARDEISNLLGSEDIFSYPKPSGLIEKLINMVAKDEDIFLDFFSGSGTTAHAVMALNAEDGGNRKHISVQLAEPTDEKSEAYKAGYKTIFEITRERIIRAAKKIKEEHPDAACDFGFKEFKTIPANEGPFAHYLDDADTMEDYIPFDGMALGEDDLAALLTTWKVYDGLPLHQDLQAVDLAGYTAYQGDDILYFVHKGLDISHITEMLKRIDDEDSFTPRKLVVFHHVFGDKILREFSEAINAPNRKHLELAFEQRF